MNRLRLFNFGRNRGMWNQLLRLTGRRNNNNIVWTILSLGLGIAATAVFSMRRGRNAQYMMPKPIQRAMRGITGLMNQRMRTPSLATMEFSKEIAEKPKSTPMNHSYYQQQK
ncbi:hypothetical protein BV455_00558 [Parageobacillus caldoxylosilyticus]|uniref:hypothetical protein n=1 Tax=Saccharococcus caldoxylosilyticus TaxID=81408 RepID=UPI001C4DF040|nr:hypothetical protein [Parageobacillus caldoxylosilyticus]QXJ37296.1 hypothetical protein BV455_00558 [Parageobacillus caldoxylosilyticus]